MVRGTKSWIEKIILAVLIITMSPWVCSAGLGFVESLEVSQDQITLADLVTGAGEIPETWYETVVSERPKPGQRVELTSSVLKLRLRQAGSDPDLLGISIPTRIVLSAPGQGIAAEFIKGEFRKLLLEVLDYPTSDFQLELVGWPDEITVAPGRISIRITEDKTRLRESLFRGYTTFGYAIMVDGVPAQTGRARARISGRVSVPVLIRDLQRHTVVSAEDLTFKEVDLVRIKPSTYTGIEKIIGYRSTRLIRSGLPLDPADIEISPLVTYNSRVKIRAQLHGIYIETSGKALMDGRMGEVIKVENTSSGVIIRAEVTGLNEVQALL